MVREFWDFCHRFALVTWIAFGSLAISLGLLTVHFCSSEAEIASKAYPHNEIAALIMGGLGLFLLAVLLIGYLTGPRERRRK